MKPYLDHQSKYSVLKKIIKGCRSPAMLKIEKTESKMQTNQQKLQCSVSMDELLAFLNLLRDPSTIGKRNRLLRLNNLQLLPSLPFFG